MTQKSAPVQGCHFPSYSDMVSNTVIWRHISLSLSLSAISLSFSPPYFSFWCYISRMPRAPTLNPSIIISVFLPLTILVHLSSYISNIFFLHHKDKIWNTRRDGASKLCSRHTATHSLHAFSMRMHDAIHPLLSSETVYIVASEIVNIDVLQCIITKPTPLQCIAVNSIFLWYSVLWQGHTALHSVQWWPV